MEQKIGCQKLTEEEVKIWIPNRKLQLTQKAEIERLKRSFRKKTLSLKSSRGTMKSARRTATVSNRTTL